MPDDLPNRLDSIEAEIEATREVADNAVKALNGHTAILLRILRAVTQPAEGEDKLGEVLARILSTVVHSGEELAAIHKLLDERR